MKALFPFLVKESRSDLITATKSTYSLLFPYSFYKTNFYFFIIIVLYLRKANLFFNQKVT